MLIETKARVKRQHLKEEVRDFLEAEFLKNPIWTKAYTKELGVRLGLDQVKVYKWNFDRNKKETRVRASLKLQPNKSDGRS